MCQCQLSGSSLPSEAETPPCAATVWERVGNTLERTATRRSARASSSAARMPEPPAPTTTASNLLTGIATLHSPEYLPGPHAIAHERENHGDVKHETKAGVLYVVHENVADTDPRMQQHAQDEEDGRVADDRKVPQRTPALVIEFRQRHDDADEKERIQEHHHGGDALDEVALPPV